MKQIRIVLLALVAAILVGCGTSSTVPISGRKRTLMVSDVYEDCQTLYECC